MKYNFFLIAVILFGVVACKKAETEEFRLREYSEVATENDAQIQDYLKTHYYTLDENSKVTLHPLQKADKHTPLSEQVKSMVVKIKDTHGDYINHTIYYLILKQGTGEKSSVSDRVYVTYNLYTLSNELFQSLDYLSQDNWFDLIGDPSKNKTGTTIGFRQSVALLNDSAQTGFENTDGTILLPEGYGQGIFFMPSGVSYFSQKIAGEHYRSLIFEIKLLKTQPTDHDNDGILTRDEIRVKEGGIIEYPDCNANTIPDYLDYRKCN